jgi:hypothetical protein
MGMYTMSLIEVMEGRKYFTKKEITRRLLTNKRGRAKPSN